MRRMRLIDADALKKVFRNEYKVSFAEAIDEVIDEQPTVKQERMIMNWIPVDERLPEEFTGVIVWVEGEFGGFAVGYRDDDVWKISWNGAKVSDYGYRVTAWMPLPEPYNPEEEKRKTRTKGSWVAMDEIPFEHDTNMRIYCSECGYRSDDFPTHFCPNCGADMRGEEE